MNPSIFPPGAETILRQHYPDIAAIQSAFLEISPDSVPTEEQIRLKARKTGIARMAATPRFTLEEDAVLDRLYPDIDACKRELANRSKREIQRRAWHLKKERAGGPFTEAEDAFIVRLFPDLAALQAELPGRPQRAIKRRAAELGVATTVGKHQRYTAAQRRLIRVFYPNYDLLCALLAPRTREGIKFTASAMGLTAGKVGSCQGGHTESWSDAEKAALTKYGAKLPGRSKAAIESARRRFGVVVEPNPAIAKREALNNARRAEAQARASARRAAAAAAAEEQKRRNAAWAAERLRKIEAERAAQAEAARRQRDARKAAAAEEGRRRRAQERARAAPVAAPVRSVPPVRRPTPSAPARFMGPDIDPRVISAAGQSRYGVELVATVQRTVPRDLWPHVKPRVIEDLTMAVVDGRCAPDGLAEMLPGAIQAVMRSQFQGASQ